MRNYEQGKQITSLDELAQQEFIFVHDHLYHMGWFRSWPLRNCMNLLQAGRVYAAVRRKEGVEHGNDKA